MVPSYNWKVISGWINYSGMVISHKIIERAMEYRGSKSVTCGRKLCVAVKEQRVDGSWYKRIVNFYKKILRILLSYLLQDSSLVFKVYSNGFREKLSSQNPFLVNNVQIGSTWYKGGAPLFLTQRLKIGLQSSHILANKGLNFTKSLNYSTGSQIATTAVSQQQKLSGWWVAGFVDAEGCFRISILKNKNYKGNPWSPHLYSENNGLGNTMPLSVRLYFQIGLHLKDEKILKLIQSTLGGASPENYINLRVV